MNLTIIMGRATKEPEVKYTQDGKAIAKYSLAVDSGYGEKKTTDFINITAFDKCAEFAEKYVNKGTKLLVTGHIKTGSYTNKDGAKVYTTDVIADKQEFAESKGEQPKPITEAFDGFNVEIEEELPFGSVQR